VRAILTFHSVDPSGSVLSIAPAELRSLVLSIRRSGHRIVDLAQMLASPATPRRIALTFDDGVASLHEHALPLLADLDAPATLFLTTGWLGRDNRWPGMPADAPHMTMLDWEQVRALRSAGWSIQAHTVNHPDLRALGDGEIDRELEDCDSEIEGRLGVRPDVFAYPYGLGVAGVAARARRRYRHAVTAAMGTLPEVLADPMRVPRLETYYFREPRVHRRFGGALFRGYLAARATLRRLRHAG
jgi:peptidoglycan/xylan/chitin deacetylase (PgdA/CDA1 family)